MIKVLYNIVKLTRVNGQFDFQGIEVGNMIKIWGILKLFVMDKDWKLLIFTLSFKWLDGKVLNSIILF